VLILIGVLIDISYSEHMYFKLTLKSHANG